MNSQSFHKVSQQAYQSSTNASTNEVALWAPHPYICPPPKLPNPCSGAQELIFHTVHDNMILTLSSTYWYHPFCMSFRCPRESSPSPGTGMHAHYHFYQIVVICSLSSYIFHVGYLVFVFRYLLRRLTTHSILWPSYVPFRYMFKTGM
jgi:hypothetical protein